MDVIDELIACFEAWEPEALEPEVWEPEVCVMGNVRAGEAAKALRGLRADLTMAGAFHKAAVAQRNSAWEEIEHLRAELAAVRELMNCYNVGGWTDSLALMKERDEAMAELAGCRAAINDFLVGVSVYNDRLKPGRCAEPIEGPVIDALRAAAHKGEGEKE